jgi:hypothetical protein
VSTKPQEDPLASIRATFKKHAGSLIRQPSDRDLYNIAIIVERSRNAPIQLTHGKQHRQLAKAVNIILKTVPGLLDEAEDEVVAANKNGHSTDFDHFISRAKVLLEAAEPFRGITARRDIRGAWHGWARIMQQQIRSVLGNCGKPNVSFSAEEAVGTRIIAELLGKSQSQVVEALWKAR